VRIHNDGQAAALSGALNAQAFTVGKDIYFLIREICPGFPGWQAFAWHMN